MFRLQEIFSEEDGFINLPDALVHEILGKGFEVRADRIHIHGIEAGETVRTYSEQTLIEHGNKDLFSFLALIGDVTSEEPEETRKYSEYANWTVDISSDDAGLTRDLCPGIRLKRESLGS